MVTPASVVLGQHKWLQDSIVGRESALAVVGPGPPGGPTSAEDSSRGNNAMEGTRGSD